MKLSKLKLNDKNPRFIRDEKFELLKANIKKYPKFLEKRPIVYDPEDGNKILAGNMRFRALKALGFKDIPEVWAVSAADLSEEEKAAFTIIDNVPYGQWNWDALANEWDVEELTEWGMDMPEDWGFEEPGEDELTEEEVQKPATMKITFETPEQLQSAEIDIQELIDRKYQGAYFSVSAGEL